MGKANTRCPCGNDLSRLERYFVFTLSMIVNGECKMMIMSLSLSLDRAEKPFAAKVRQKASASNGAKRARRTVDFNAGFIGLSKDGRESNTCLTRN